MSSNLATPTNEKQSLTRNSPDFENGPSCDASRIARFSEPKALEKASRIDWGGFANLIEYMAACADSGAWVDLVSVFASVLPVEARAAFAWSALRSLDTCEQSEMVAEAALRCADYPLPPFLSPMRDARFWASHANRRELKAYALTAFEAMPASDQTSFLQHIERREEAA